MDNGGADAVFAAPQAAFSGVLKFDAASAGDVVTLGYNGAEASPNKRFGTITVRSVRRASTCHVQLQALSGTG